MLKLLARLDLIDKTCSGLKRSSSVLAWHCKIATFEQLFISIGLVYLKLCSLHYLGKPFLNLHRPAYQFLEVLCQKRLSWTYSANLPRAISGLVAWIRHTQFEVNFIFKKFNFTLRFIDLIHDDVNRYWCFVFCFQFLVCFIGLDYISCSPFVWLVYNKLQCFYDLV